MTDNEMLPKLTLQDLQLKQIDQSGRFAGYASIFNVVDNQNDMMLPGAFANTLQEQDDIKLLWQHDFAEPIGVFDMLREDARGLYVEGRLLLDVQRAKEAHTLLKAGAIAGLSIGYVPVDYSIDADSGVRLLKEVALFEVSFVTFPANAEARVSALKAGEAPEATKADWSAHIRNSDFIHLADELDRAAHILTS